MPVKGLFTPRGRGSGSGIAMVLLGTVRALL